MKIVLICQVRKLSNNPTFRHGKIAPAETTLARIGPISGKSLTIIQNARYVVSQQSNRKVPSYFFIFTPMSENIETPSVLKADKTSWADNIAATIRSIIPKSPKRLYLLIDIIFGEIKSRHGYDEISRSFLSSVFFP